MDCERLANSVMTKASGDEGVMSSFSAARGDAG